MKIFLIGFMGSGKTSLGKYGANKAEWEFLDLDEYIESQEGKSISDFFSQEGEEKFRQIEKEALRSLSQKETNILVSCGGGTACFHDNMKWMNENGITLFLDPPFNFLFQRLTEEKNKDKRPLLNDENSTKDFLWELWLSRRQFYSQALHRISGPYLQKKRFGPLIQKIVSDITIEKRD